MVFVKIVVLYVCFDVLFVNKKYIIKCDKEMRPSPNKKKDN